MDKEKEVFEEGLDLVYKIEKSNTDIAIFLGGKREKYKKSSKLGYTFPEGILNAIWIDERYLMFHASWDMLMPACKKFDELYREVKGLLDNTEYMMHCDNIDDSVTTYEISSAFEALVKAIDWYQLYQKHLEEKQK